MLDSAWAALLGALVGAIAGIFSSWLSIARQERAEQRKWHREQRRHTYARALQSLARATIIPIGTDSDNIKSWFQELAELRESLIVLQIYCRYGESELIKATEEFFDETEKYSFAYIATQAAAEEKENGKRNDIVLRDIANIRAKIYRLLESVTASARIDLGQEIIMRILGILKSIFIQI
jgi:hypothetical protein